MKKISIHKKEYLTNPDEFQKVPHDEFNHLCILKNLGLMERLVSLLREFRFCGIKNLYVFHPTHGGWLPIQCTDVFEVTLCDVRKDHESNIIMNIKTHNVQNIKWGVFEQEEASIVYAEDVFNINVMTDLPLPIIVSPNKLDIDKNIYNVYTLFGTSYSVYIPSQFMTAFMEQFSYFIQPGKVLKYDNLINLCIMVKNAGPQFESMLTDNLPLVDRWTVLDTGSTDDTVNIVKKVMVGKKKGELYEEPFINFRDSRNRLLNLAGKECKYTLMLDDTYVIKGTLRQFLDTVRGDQYADSFSLFMNSHDSEYASNRVVKTSTGLRYIHRIHEVITDKDNINVIIPKHIVSIDDRTFSYMQERTMERKKWDLDMLFTELEDDVNCPRTYYYIAQTYNGMKMYDKAYEYFIKRAEFINAGFIQERYDAVFEAARLANFQLNKPWAECEDLYNKAHSIDPSRPEAAYFLGVHYLSVDEEKAFDFFKKGFLIGYPQHCQYSLKPTLSFHFLPKFLIPLCYTFNDYKLGEASAELFLQKNKPGDDGYEIITSWYAIFKTLNVPVTKSPLINFPSKPLFVFIADGGFNNWNGNSIKTIGVGGSETYIIEMARFIQKNSDFNVVVFCKCLEEEYFEDVQYQPLGNVFSFVQNNYIHTCIVSRFSEYIPMVFKGNTENVYMVVHDLGPSGIVIPMDPKLKKIFCLTEWHAQYMSSNFPALKDIIVPFYYGIDTEKFRWSTKVPHRFIYSSFPNRGLLPLLQMWPRIQQNQSKASLHIYSDVDGEWVNSKEPDQMKQIRALLEEHRNNKMNIVYHGWVDKKTLARGWSEADIWLYPCTFMETFCLTAMEAALTKTLAITNDLAALQNTVGDRGVVIPGDASTQEWQDQAVAKVIEYMKANGTNKTRLLEKNYQWAKNMSWEDQAKRLLDRYIYQHVLEHKNKYFITPDLSNITLNNPTILDVYTHTGGMLIDLVNRFKGSSGVGIDPWDDKMMAYASFKQNVKRSNLDNRITGLKKDVVDYLIKTSKTYDIINVNTMEDNYHCYTIYLSAWRLLNKSGILIMTKSTKNLDAINALQKQFSDSISIIQDHPVVVFRKK